MVVLGAVDWAGSLQAGVRGLYSRRLPVLKVQPLMFDSCLLQKVAVLENSFLHGL